MPEIEKVKFSCPKCNVRITTKSGKIQETIKCPKCSHSFLGMAANNIEFFTELSPIEEKRNNQIKIKEIPPSKYEQIQEIPPVQYKKNQEIPPSQYNKNSEVLYYEDKKDSNAFGCIFLTAIIFVSFWGFLAFLAFISAKNPGGIQKDFQIFSFAMMIISFLWLIMPLLIAYLAEEKTGHAWLWFFLSIILTPIFQIILIIILLTKDKNSYLPND